jgi:hypothetical protein
LKRKNTTCYKDPKTGKWKIYPEYQKKRSREWRQRFYALGYTYKRVRGRWGWTKKKSRMTRAKIHSSDPEEIEGVRRKILEASRK